MKTIKDILKADNIEQRRRIANNLAISREDKNALIVNQSNGGGSGNNDITYYKVNLDNAPDDNFHDIKLIACMVAAEMKAIFGESGNGFSNFIIGPAGSSIFQASDNFKPLAIGVPSYIKLITGMLDDNDNIIDKDSMIVEGTLKEVIDTLSEAFRLQINVFDYFEPITKEEFYSLKN